MCGIEIDSADPIERWREGVEACGVSAHCYAWCACRDCFNVAISGHGRIPYCEDCIEAGCPDYQGVHGMPQECQAAGTASGFDIGERGE